VQRGVAFFFFCFRRPTATVITFSSADYNAKITSTTNPVLSRHYLF
jgi:hypothetical protein